MFTCDVCGKEVTFPYSCKYCHGFFCADHQLPENHNCPKKPTTPPSYSSSPSFTREKNRKIGSCPRCHSDGSDVIKYNAEKIIFRCWNCGLVYGQRKSFPYYYFRVHKRKVVIKNQPEQPIKSTPYKSRTKTKSNKTFVALVLVGILIASIFLAYSINDLFFNSESVPLPLKSSSSTTNFTLATPTPIPTRIEVPTIAPIVPPSVISITENQQDLVNYALSLINIDRQSNGLQNVSLSSINSGQIHADDMLKNGYFGNLSHWSTNGYKPYMRYTLAGGRGAVSENCAWQGIRGNVFAIDVKSELKELEWSMMYDDASSNWGHKDNILTPLHNKVSIGVAYNFNNVYFVEDFEDDYISWNQLSVSNNQVVMQGTTLSQQSTIEQIAIFYDNPTPLNVNQLGQAPYNGGYDPGTFVGSVLTGNWQAQNGITIKADNWQQNGNSFQISFSLSQAITAYGKGVYTLYLETGSSTADSLTTYSIWV